jgi:DNA-binding transcriptional MerR regulator
MGNQTIQDKKYYSISEVSELCNIKSHTLRFWEKEFKDLKPVTRKGNRRYYQTQDIQLVKKIQTLLYEQGMTIAGAKKNIQSSPADNSQDSKIKKVIDDLEDLLSKIK